MNSPDAFCRYHSATPAQRPTGPGRTLRRIAFSSGLLLLAGCQAATEAGRSLPDLNELSVMAGLTTPAPVILRGGTPAAPAGSRAGSCYVRDISPAVVESITEQVQIKPELLDRNTGDVIQQAGYRTEIRQRIISERAEIMVQTPCPETQDFAFIATLQRALKARGFYLANVTGIMDARTRRAIRGYQVARGVNSDVLSVDSAIEMGLIATGSAPR
jgi:putative peptidoglycan binding protein